MSKILSFTTSPTRLFKCDKMIESILKQTILPDKIILNIPPLFERTKEPYIIPDTIKEMIDKQLIEINYCDRDWGPGTKIIPTIQYLHKYNYNNDTRIIYCDDDIYYPPHMIETFLTLNKDSVWAASGFQFINFRILGKRNHNDNISIVEGYGGVCVTLSMFNNDFIEYISDMVQYNDVKLSDDIMLSNYYWKQNIPMRVCNIKNKHSFNDIWYNNGVLDYGNKEDALHNGASNTSMNNNNRYLNVLSFLSKNKNRFFPVYFLDKNTNEITKK